MAHKTISLDLQAYEALRSRRTQPSESFSQVVLRLASAFPGSTSGSAIVDKLLADGESLWFPPDAELDRLDAIQKEPRARRNPRSQS